MSRIKKLKNALDIQVSNGNWNYDEYNFGMANGLILAYSIITNTEAKFKNKPKKFKKEASSHKSKEKVIKQ